MFSTANGSVKAPQQKDGKQWKEKAFKLATELFGLEVEEISQLHGFFDKNFKIVSSKGHTGEKVYQTFILKILNVADSATQHAEAEVDMQQHLWKQGMCCPVTVPTLNGELVTRQIVKGFSGEKVSVIRLLTYLPGILLTQVPYTTLLLESYGGFIGKMTTSLKDFHHPALDHYDTSWDLSNVPQLRHKMHVIDDQYQRKILLDIVCEFEDMILKVGEKLRKSIIHGDCNDKNVIVSKKDSLNNNHMDCSYNISAVIDFGDARRTYTIAEIAIAIMHMMTSCKSQAFLDIGRHILSGYLRHMEILEAEWSALGIFVLGRYCQVIVFTREALQLDPDNLSVAVDEDKMWKQMEMITKVGTERLCDSWRAMCTSVHKEIE